MLAGILPGLRDVRAPLAAGYLWLCFGWLIVSDDVATAEGVVGRVVELGGVVTDAALAVAASFAAYLIGSLSEDFFRAWLIRLVHTFVWLPDIEAEARLEVENIDTSTLDAATIDAEIAKLENTASRLDAESSLRIAIVPPLVAIYVYLVVDSWWWLLAGIFLPLLLVQALLRSSDSEVARRALWDLRRTIGLPPASAREATSAK